MKAMTKRRLVEGGDIEHILTERDVQIQIMHPFLDFVQFSFQNDVKILFVLDYIPRVELFVILKLKSLFRGNSLKLERLHSLEFIYRDIKLENIRADQ
jgi:protein kinase A